MKCFHNNSIKNHINHRINIPSKTLLNCLLILVFIGESFNMSFEFELNPGKMTCFGEYLYHNSNSKIQFNSDSSNFQVKVFDPNGNTIFSKENKQEVKIRLIATESGIFQFCLDNFSKKGFSVTMNILTGVAAKDYSSLVTVAKVQPIELQLIKLHDTVDYLNKEVGEVFSHEIHHKMLNHDGITYSIFTYSGIVIGLIIVFNLAEYFVLKRFIDNRKKI
jgi:hypothetical protein